jgi:hypothetical protein
VKAARKIFIKRRITRRSLPKKPNRRRVATAVLEEAK